MATAFLAVLLRGVLATSPSLGEACSERFLAVRLAAGFFAVFSAGGVISAAAESSLTGSGDP